MNGADELCSKKWTTIYNSTPNWSNKIGVSNKVANEWTYKVDVPNKVASEWKHRVGVSNKVASERK